MKNLNYLVLVFSLLLLTACSKKEREVYIENTTNYIYTDLIVSGAQLNWNVKLVINGVDYGIIKAGEKAGPFTFKGIKFKIDTFEPQISCLDAYLSHTYNSGATYCITSMNDEVEAKAQEYRDKKWNVPVANDEWTWQIGFGNVINP